MKKGKFIVLEGLDGSGKSTQIKLLHENLSTLGIPAVITAEPTKDTLGMLIREFLRGNIELNDETAAILFAADRLEHIHRFILPKLSQGIFVLCDRFYMSNLAYQGGNVSYETLLKYNESSIEKAAPDLTIFLEINPEICLKRIKARGSASEKFEHLDELYAIRRRYYEVFDLKHQTKIITQNAEADTKQLSAAIFNAVRDTCL